MRTCATILALLAILGGSLWIRERWPRLTRGARRRWIAVALIGILSRSLSDALRWELIFSRVNDLLLWGRVGGYILLVVLFTRLRPRRLTVPAAGLLLLPLLSATVYLPLELVFDFTPRRLTRIGDRVTLEQTAWRRWGIDNRAVDFTVARRSRRLPFLQRSYFVGRLYRTQCDTDAITATLTSPTLVLLHCPSAEAGEAPYDQEIPLFRTSHPAPPTVVPSHP